MKIEHRSRHIPLLYEWLADKLPSPYKVVQQSYGVFIQRKRKKIAWLEFENKVNMQEQLPMVIRTLLLQYEREYRVSITVSLPHEKDIPNEN